MRARRFLLLWCAALLVAGVGGLGGFGSSAQALLVTGPPPGAEEPTQEEPPTTATSPTTLVTDTSVSQPPPSVAAPPSTVSVDEAIKPPPGDAVQPTPSLTPPSAAPAPDPQGLLPCAVKPGESVPTAGGSTGVVPLYIDNCRPITGDMVGIYAYGGYPGNVVRVSFGDGTFAGANPGDPSCSFSNGQVRQQHRYPKAGRFLVEATTWYPCASTPKKVVSAWVEVSDGQVPQAPGAAPCRGLGPVKPGDPARQGVGVQPVSTPRLPDLRVELLRCSVALGGNSAILLGWYEAAAFVDWGDGTKPVAMGAKGQQGATLIHTHATRGLHVVTVVVLDHESKPIPQVTFTMQVT